ncbi:hypothetical protein CMV_017954 [Castanea mollissima]|uniref:Uncharacterized protein n=1 Tax=Castanea mollissima TaxID=60419 RepID=A0A8J4VD56_9ROSI|nr:hypothetical protein CMV_017954 [Castanea mollissima]
MVVGSASADDCAVKPLMSSAAKWGKRLFIGCIPIEATLIMCGCIPVSLDMYLPKLEQCQKPLEENIIVYLGTVCGKTHIAVLLIHKLSHLIRKPRKKICIFLPLRWLWFSSLAMLWTCIFPWMKEWAEVCPRCHHDMPLVGFGMCLGSRSIKGKSLRNSLLSQRNSRILGEVKTEESI